MSDSSRASHSRQSVVPPLVAACCVFAGLAWWTHSMQQEQVESARITAMVNAAQPPRPLADVASAAATMKLVTVEIDTTVKVERGEESWRGNVLASIEVPVRLSYGVDLSKLQVSRLGWSPVTQSYIVCVPHPTRVATQVFSERLPPKVELGWLRLRSQAGEYFVSQARKDVADVAVRLELKPADAAKVESTTREQVASLIRTIAGPDAGVVVRFIDDTGAAS
jgi:hypothetical protein